MSSRTYMGSRAPSAATFAGGLSTVTVQSTTFLSGLDKFFELLDGRDPWAVTVAAAPVAVVLNMDYFQLDHQFDLPCEFGPVAGWTWSQGLWSILELASHAATWALDHQLDPQHDRLVHQWNDSIGLALLTELTARTHLLPTPYLGFQAGMLLAAVGMSEQLRLMEQDERCPQVMLTQSTVRQVEGLVVQHDLAGSLSLVQTIRKGSYLGPWSALALAHRLARAQVGLAWVAGLVEPVELLPSTRVLEKSLRIGLRTQWPQYHDLAERIWQTAIAVARRGR